MHYRNRKIGFHKYKAKILIAVCIGILALVVIYFVIGFLDQADQEVIENAGESVHAEQKVTSITYDNKTLPLNSHIQNILLIGIDSFDQTPLEHSDAYYNYQQADFLSLASVNTDAKTISILHLNRDTMTDVPWLTINGKVGGTNYEQIALSHTYGSGREDSCKNTVNTVSSLLFNLPIDHYICISMSGLPKLNDAVGGVSVFVKEDFSESDPTLIQGEYNILLGDHALKYVRARKEIGQGTNLERMDRQKQYMDGFLKAFQAASQEDDFYAKFLDAGSDYLITDMTVDGLANTLNQFCEYEVSEILSPEGSAVLNQKTNYIEFTINKESLFQKLEQMNS